MAKLSGIVPPMVTPLVDRDTLDQPGLEKLVEHIVAGQASGLFLLGTTGEAPSLSYRLRAELVNEASKVLNGRLPFVVGITDTAFVESVQLARIAADAGAAAVVVTPPYYFPAGQTELRAYIRNLVAELPLPLVLYNMPALTKVWFEISTLESLLDCEQIIGIKDSSGDLGYFQQVAKLKEQREDWCVLMGPEALLPYALAAGGDGGVAGGANVHPRLFHDYYRAACELSPAGFAATHDRVLRFQELYNIGKYASRFIKATKCCLSLMDICSDFMAEPFHAFKSPERNRVKQILETDFPELLL